MGPNQIQKYVWLVNTIRRRRMISLKEINHLWVANKFLNDGNEIPRRTLYKWCQAIEEMFGIKIANVGRGEYQYYIKEDDDFRKSSACTWIFNTIAVNNMLLNYKSLQDRILLESVPSGQKHLTEILEAMDNNRMIGFDYHSYWKDEPEHLEVEPYCVKLAKRRWYVLARCPQDSLTKAYPIDRIDELKILDDRPFKMPKDFSAEEYFRDFFGATIHDGSQVEHVKLKVCGNQMKYFRSLPLHPSQIETYKCDEYSIFEYVVHPTYDFQQVILSHAPDVVVLEPESLREEIKWKIEEMIKRYEV